MSDTLDYKSVRNENTSCETDAVSCTYLGRANYADLELKISSKIFGHGGPRANSGGPRPNSGGARPGAGRPSKKPIVYVQRGDTLLWYCARTEYGAELDADLAFRTAGFQTFLPLEWIPPVPASRTETGRTIPGRYERIVPLFPSTLFVRLALTHPAWRSNGIASLIKGLMSIEPEKPIAIPECQIDWLRDGLAPNGCWYPNGFATAVERDEAKKAKRVWVDWFNGLDAVRTGLAA